MNLITSGVARTIIILRLAKEKTCRVVHETRGECVIVPEYIGFESFGLLDTCIVTRDPRRKR